MLRRILVCYNACFKEGKFPSKWKRARVVLIPKDNNKITKYNEAVKARPICLINDLAKTLERIINNKIMQWMVENPEFELSTR